MIEGLQSQLQPYLDAGETLLWVGKPKQGIQFKRDDIFKIPFYLVWGGFAVFWETMTFINNAPLFFKLYRIPFILVGIYFNVGRFFFDAKRREMTLYGITKTRIIIKSGVFSQSIKTL